MASPSTSANGGILGKSNNTSFGRCFVNEKKSSGTITTQPGTRVVRTLVIAGGGGGGVNGGGGGGAGGSETSESGDGKAENKDSDKKGESSSKN